MRPDALRAFLFGRLQRVVQVPGCARGEFLIQVELALAGGLRFARVHQHEVVDVAVRLVVDPIAVVILRIELVEVLPGEAGVLRVGGTERVLHERFGPDIAAPLPV